MGQYGYNAGNAATFNQLVRTGLDTADASTQSGVSTYPSQYGYGTNSNAGAVIPGAGGQTDAAGLTQVPYAQPASGEPAQQPAQISTPSANSGFGYGTGAANPSVTPVPAAEATTSPYSAFSQVQTVPQPLQTPASEPSPFSQDPAQRAAAAAAATATPAVQITPNQTVDPQQAAAAAAAAATTTPAPQATPNQTVDPQQALQQRLNNQPSGVNANTAGLPVLNEAGQVVTTTTTPADVVQNDAETARLARLNLAATPNQSDAETRRLQEQNVQAAVGTQLAQRQVILDAQRKLVNNGDWRVRLSLAQNSKYLYNAPNPGILAPLAKTGGVIFPYTPKISTSYKADYDSYALTHSNYKGYFYKGSYNDAVSLSGTFTAQDSVEAQYLLAVIHFFRSVTKMFYGQDAERGAPPPLVYLTGLGQYQFSAHPCAVTSFEYSLPTDVDYIRAGSANINGTNLLSRRIRQDLPTDPISGSIKRLQTLFSSQGINKGAIADPPAPPTLGKDTPTYVPTKMEISLSLLPMQTRAQVSQVFSLKSFANGDLIKGGFW